ncbi:AraC family transcriptional regulator [Amycolatopsis rhabdoformis]|uniref:AraC family transcriptional regulator n=1 Tax=Amycolatopsis rhabdoformis TaxID=1448059 RepID=A0ABZ1IET2_9PSEU|nr:AraC family transcriptional regulator [Amycolatopsis rhabdoformis]WSE32198.1 AraC family transcriptional regulator [Amycolatopsis rhabdoformis]
MEPTRITSVTDYHQVLSDSFGTVTSDTISEKLSAGEISSHHLGHDVSLVESRSHDTGSPNLAAFRAKASSSGLVFFTVITAGRALFRQHDRVAEVATGEGVLCEAQQDWEVRFPLGKCSLTLAMPSDLLAARSSVVSERCTRAMNSGQPSTGLLTRYLTHLYELAGGLSIDQRADAGVIARDLLAMTLRGLTVAPESAGPDVTLAMLRTYIHRHLADSRLTVADLARLHQLSPRYVHKLFDRIETTPAAYIREHRALAARAILSDRAYDHWDITEVAAAAGFAELRTMERVFRTRFGLTPTQWRHFSSTT